jgi:hypothetical protein
MVRCALVMMLAACSGGHVPAGNAPAARGSSAAAQCPPVGQAACQLNDQCRHGDVVCTCTREPWCKGEAPTEEEEHATTWECVGPLVPGECPHDEPFASSACTVEGQTCDYSCGCIRSATCTGGVWKIHTGDCRK